MSEFDKFKGNVTHAQPVETKVDEWKGHLDSVAYHLGTTMKGVAAFSLLATMVAGPTAAAVAIFAGAYVIGSTVQALFRTMAENRLAEDRHEPVQEGFNRQHMKNTAKHLFKPW